MVSGYILVLAVLVLGGVIATIGDRLGSKIGKARLSLFNLRPKDTAVVVTILTGGFISASTLGILFATSAQLRAGVFEFNQVQDRLRQARQDLETARRDLEASAAQREQARRSQQEAQRQLDRTNQQLRAAVEQQRQTAVRLEDVETRSASLRSDLVKLQQERQDLLAQRQAVRDQIDQLKTQLQSRDREVGSREAQLRELESKQTSLTREIQQLEQTLIAFRRGNVALTRGQVLVSKLVQILAPQGTQEAIDMILREANVVAAQATRPGIQEVREQIIQIPQAEVDRLREQLRTGRPFVVRILSAANVVVGEPRVFVFSDATPNQLLLPAGRSIGSTSLVPSSLDADELRQRINLLLTAAQLRARQQGVLSEVLEIGDGRIETLLRFLSQLRQTPGEVTIEVVTSEAISTADALQLDLRAIQNGQVKFSTEP